LSFVSLSWSGITDKPAINWQNFTRVRLQLKFAFNPGLNAISKIGAKQSTQVYIVLIQDM